MNMKKEEEGGTNLLDLVKLLSISFVQLIHISIINFSFFFFFSNLTIWNFQQNHISSLHVVEVINFTIYGAAIHLTLAI